MEPRQTPEPSGAIGFALFDTPVGACGIAWSARGIAGTQLPEGSVAGTRAWMQRRFPGVAEAEPPPEAQHAIDAIRALLNGERIDLSAIPLDMTGVPEFQQRVYAVARTVPAGATLTYGAIAARLGDSSAARAVGQALGQNPFGIIVPCHRILAAGGRMGGFSAGGGTATKQRLLAIEGAALALGA
jgi:methylated-DNA-[protein]-cysteine S-methyltransferase